MKAITEEMKLHEEWYKEAREQTSDTLPDFIKKLTTEYSHDYGTICHAVASAAIAAASAVNKSDQGGITGFQAGCIMWSFMREWMHFGDNPLKLVDYKNMLYPQYEGKFDKSISSNAWEWLQKEAKKMLKGNTSMHENVRAHITRIANGEIPFGYSVNDD